jgi:hypothetical protein
MGAAASLVDREEGVALEFHGKRVSMPTHARQALQCILDNPELQASQLPDALDEAHKQAVARTLRPEDIATSRTEARMANSALIGGRRHGLGIVWADMDPTDSIRILDTDPVDRVVRIDHDPRDPLPPGW